MLSLESRSKHMRMKFLLAMILLLSFARCNSDGDGEQRRNLVLYGGMESRRAWRLQGSEITDGVLRLARTSEHTMSLASQLLPPLAENEMLLMSVTVRADSADAPLYVDLYGFGWDHPEQQIVVPVSDMSRQFVSHSVLIPSASSDMGIWLRVFTDSKSPIEIDEIMLRPIPGSRATSTTPNPIRRRSQVSAGTGQPDGHNS